MELDRGHGPTLDGAHELATVVRERQHPVGVGRLPKGPVGVHEVELLSSAIGEERRVTGQAKAVPAHVRDRQTGRVEAPHLPGNHPQTGNARQLLAALEQGLQTETDPEERASFLEIPAQRFHVAARVQPLHRAAEAADTREDQHLGTSDVLRALGVAHIVAEPTDGVANAPHVAGAVVQNRDRSHEPSSGQPGAGLANWTAWYHGSPGPEPGSLPSSAAPALRARSPSSARARCRPSTRPAEARHSATFGRLSIGQARAATIC